MSDRYIKVSQVDEERLDDELLLLHRETLQVRLLNETAAVFWDALGEFQTALELQRLLTETRPELPAEESLGYVTTFLDELEAAQLVKRCKQTAP
jgi:hypothetical protein